MTTIENGMKNSAVVASDGKIHWAGCSGSQLNSKVKMGRKSLDKCPWMRNSSCKANQERVMFEEQKGRECD